MKVLELIQKWKINQVLLAEKIGMPNGTFKTKYSENLTSYKFSEIEIEKITQVLNELANDIKKVKK